MSTKINLNRLEEAETLPFRESRWQHLEKEHGGMWNLRRWDGYSSDKAYSPYKFAERTIDLFQIWFEQFKKK